MAAARSEVGSSDQKLEYLDTLRGLAALGAVLAHLILTFWPGVFFRSGPAWEQSPGWFQVIFRFPLKFFVNGQLLSGEQPIEEFDKAIQPLLK